jgi:dipeptidyl aminopeptidase/acylaminoacyl peptidase
MASLAHGSAEITLDEVLHVRHPDHHRWSPGGGRVAFIWYDGGADQLWLADVRTGEVTQLSAGTARVTGFDWHPEGRAIAYTQGSDVWVLWDVAPGMTPVRIAETQAKESTPRWSPDGARLGFVRDGQVWTWQPNDGSFRVYAVPGRLVEDARLPAFRWSPDGTAIACLFDERAPIGDGRADRDPAGADPVPQHDLAVLSVTDRRLVWRTRTPEPEGHFVWMDAHRLYYSVTLDICRRREHYLVDLAGLLAPPRSGAAPAAYPVPRLLHIEQDEKGLLFGVEPQRSPDSRFLLFVLRHTGWDHLFALDLLSGWMRQLTDGACEDTGHAHDLPRWSPDGRRVLFSSNQTGAGHRQVWALDVGTLGLRQLTHAPGTAVQPLWSPDGEQVVYLFCGPVDAADLWLMGAGGEHPRRLTRSLPHSWGPEKMVAPTHVTFRSARDWTIHGYLYTPPVMEPGRRYPALVWVHGGPMRQMRDGWHPLHSYAIFHAFTLYLTHRGYVTLAVNYRGGIGYGVAFEQGTYRAVGVDDVADVVHAGRYLQALPYVDPRRVGVWGISYGGHMTLCALTKHPEVFALGVNIAGVWDEGAWSRWAERQYPVAARFFTARLGGPEEQQPGVWREASPRHWAHRMRAPLVNLHGTGDAAVPFAQLDQIVADCVAHEKAFETHYYPGETHVFTHRRTWADAFRKIERAFERYLMSVGERSGDDDAAEGRRRAAAHDLLPVHQYPDDQLAL